MENLELAKLHSNTIRCVIAWIDMIDAPQGDEPAYIADLAHAKAWLEEALVKVAVYVEPAAIAIAGVVADNNAAGRAAEGGAQVVYLPKRYEEVPAELRAVVDALIIEEKGRSGLRLTWEGTAGFIEAMENGYNPNDHFRIEVGSDGTAFVVAH